VKTQTKTLHILIWLYCLKSKLVGHSRFACAVDMASAPFNTGAKATSERIRHFGIEPTEIQLACIEKEEEMRIKNAENAAKDRNWCKGKMRQHATRAVVDQLAEAEILHYRA